MLLCAICGECLINKESLEDDVGKKSLEEGDKNPTVVKFSCPNCKADVLYLIPIENFCMLEEGSGK